MDDRPDLGNVMSMMSFAAVVSTGGFSNAAKMLGYSKAAVSRQIAKLEQNIGVRLLDRTTRSVTLTPAGREMYARCARIVEEVNEANQVITGMVSKPRGELKVNAPVVSSLFDLTAIIPRFLQTYPDVRLFLNLADSKLELLKSRFDVAFWMGDPFDAGIESVRLRSYPMALVAAPGYLDAVGRPTAPNDLKDHTCIVETHL
ncbi:MAG: LysR family transcriptional regulator, partial [Alteraurantiacibacter sp.]